MINQKHENPRVISGKTRKFLLTSICVLAVTLALSACSPLDGGGGTGVITLNLNARSIAARSVAWLDNFDYVEPHIEYTVTLTGASTLTYTIEKDAKSVSVRVPAGTWNVKVDAYAAGMLIASGDDRVDVTAGKSTTAPITMNDPPDGAVDVHIIEGQQDWDDAIGSIYTGANTNPRHLFILNISNPQNPDILIDPFVNTNRFGNAAEVTIIGNSKKIILNTPGSLFYIGEKQKVTIQDVNLEDGTPPTASNTAPLVEVLGTFTMNSGTISGNNSGSSNGSGVLINGGTFIMNDGTIFGNTTNAGGGGVYVSGGTFTMNGGTISGNTADLGGGVYIDESGTFTMNGGFITDNEATGSGLNAGGIYVSKGATFNSKGGTFSGNIPSDIYREP